MKIPTPAQLAEAFDAYAKITPGGDHERMYNAYVLRPELRATFQAAIEIEVEAAIKDGQAGPAINVSPGRLYEAGFDVGLYVGMHLARAQAEIERLEEMTR